MDFISKDRLNENHLDFLKEAGRKFFLQCNFKQNDALEVLTILLERHTENQRHYHDLSHLYNLYLVKNEHENFLKNPLLIEAAIWFHDAIYIPQNKDNEAKSAELALAILKDKNLPFDLNDLKLLIESTAKHQPLKDDTDFHYFLDFDLSILAGDALIYQKYVEAIRQEYSMYPAFLYKIGRKKVLKSFLKREWIYFSEVFFERYEGRARKNILREMEG
ncbi:MAG: putative metal-dependent HD superfamily phosphohydrolase [Saprospiraceae bacterium]|jgi:predicted metal-dependent HD superfamily phosphohydrolase